MLIYNLGHAVFEFIEAKYGKEGVRQFLFALRKSVIGGGEDAYEEALRMKKEEFDQAFERYLKERFKPFRDKERPADYGRDLVAEQARRRTSPKRCRSRRRRRAISSRRSPSTARIGEIDIVLISSKDGSIVRNLTQRLRQGHGLRSHRPCAASGSNTMPWMAWSPKGDRLAYFVRTEKERTLIVQNVLTGTIEERIPMKSVDEPESPNFSPDGRTIAFVGAARRHRRHLHGRSGDARRSPISPTDEFADYGPAYSPDGKFIVYNARVSGNQKLFRLDLDTKKKTQLTFGTQRRNGGAVHRRPHAGVLVDGHRSEPCRSSPEVAKNGNIFNIWTLDLKTGELRQYTDALGGNWSPIVLNDGKTNRIAFVTYYKGEYSIHTLERKEPLHTASTADFGAPGPIIDFQAPLQHTLVAVERAEEEAVREDVPRRAAAGERRRHEQRRRLRRHRRSASATCSAISSSTSSPRRSRSTARCPRQYVNLSRRFQYALQGYSQTQFFYGQLGGVFYDPALAPLISRDQAIATRTVRGGTAFGIYPFNRYRRVELSAGLVQHRRGVQRPDLAGLRAAVPAAELRPAGLPQRHAGAARRRVRPGDDGVPRVRAAGRQHDAARLRRRAEDRQHAVAADVRRRRPPLPAPRQHRPARDAACAAFKSIGDFPDFIYFGGNSEMRGYDYLQFAGQNVVFANAELRFPLIEAALTPIGVIGGIRGVFFANIGGGWFNEPAELRPRAAIRDFKFVEPTETCTPVIGNVRPTRSDRSRSARRQRRAAADLRRARRPSPGSACRTAARRTASASKRSRSASRSTSTGRGGRCSTRTGRTCCSPPTAAAATFRKPRFAVWIGYDF